MLHDADIAIDFSSPDAAPELIIACVTAGVPVVSGTTGWQAEKPRVDRAIVHADGTLLWSPNFSLGVHVFWRAASQAARLMSRAPGVDARIVETHHSAKRDAPSGTALELARRIALESGAEPPITSIRLGSVPGTHELLLDGPFEQIRITHEARDRRVFADGALTAAEWVLDAWRSGRRGIFTMDDMIDAALNDGSAAQSGKSRNS
jgi:4-hydroxy-tetrahydrodipicolinate reductase